MANTYSGEDSGVRLDISSCVGTGKRQSEQASVEFASYSISWEIRHSQPEEGIAD